MLDARKKKVLESVIDTYLATGEPVGSKTLLDRFDLNVSSATIRSEMLELEKMGFLCKPHTSAGRIPSSDGLKYYVRNSSDTYSLTDSDLQNLIPAFKSCVGLIESIRATAGKLAEFSGCTVFTASPVYGNGMFTFEVMPAGKRTLGIMAVSSSGTVKSVFTKVDHDVTAEDANKLASILNSVFAGFPVNQIGSVRIMLFRDEVEKAAPSYQCVILPVTELVEQIKSYELFISGSEKVLSYPEFSNVQAAQEYIEMLNRRDDILDELLETDPDSDVVVRIGSESRLLKTVDASVVSVSGARYEIPIVIGVLGPSRMNYSRIIAGCKHAALMLEEHMKEEYGKG